MTIPAICPADKPSSTSSVSVPVAEGLLALVEDGNKGGKEEVSVGKTTPTQRSVTLEAAQQGSVAFGELEAQWPQRL